jgi:hypothetical protein
MYCVDTITREGRNHLGVVICPLDMRRDTFIFGS